MMHKPPFDTLILATRNQKKIEELRRVLKNQPIELRSVADYPDLPEVVEDGLTFADNAIKKAETISRITGLAALADDSGLEVDDLNGDPGVYSARYAGEAANDQENTNRVLDQLNQRATQKKTTLKREARFICVLALSIPGEAAQLFHGTVEGVITPEPKGENGFGYDPIFIPIEELQKSGQGRTFAQMSAKEKDHISHRGRALIQFAKKLPHIKR
ncbi:XTP/dITP diphosphatase [Magnetococcales bacterium HHB-1]